MNSCEENKGINLQIWQFKEGLIRYINASELPIELKNYVVKDVSEKVNKAAESQISQERAEWNRLEAEAREAARKREQECEAGKTAGGQRMKSECAAPEEPAETYRAQEEEEIRDNGKEESEDGDAESV